MSLTRADEPAPKTYSYQIVHTWPHDRGAFTQGLVYWHGFVYEGTGLYGRSRLRKVDLETGRVLQEIDLPEKYFGEGIALLGDRIFQLTWQNHQGFVYDLASFKTEREFSYPTEGWGLTTDGHSLILSDGTDTLRFLDPTTFAVQRTVSAHNQSEPIRQLNELEYIHGLIFCNLWQTNWMAEISPDDGHLVAAINLSGLLPRSDYDRDTDVLNGIAYDSEHDRLFVTGKNWPKLFEIKLVPAK